MRRICEAGWSNQISQPLRERPSCWIETSATWPRAARNPAIAGSMRALSCTALPVLVVIDHMGHLPPAGAGQDAQREIAIAVMERLLAQGRAWVNLSGAYRCSGLQPAWADTVALAQRLLAAGPDQCVWGSDWPHVSQPAMTFSPTDTLDWLGTVLPFPPNGRKPPASSRSASANLSLISPPGF